MHEVFTHKDTQFRLVHQDTCGQADDIFTEPFLTGGRLPCHNPCWGPGGQWATYAPRRNRQGGGP